MNNYELLMLVSFLSFIFGLILKVYAKAYSVKFRKILLREIMQETYEFNVPEILGNLAEMSRQSNIFHILKYIINQQNIINRFPLVKYLNEIYSAFAKSYMPNYEVYFTTNSGKKIPVPKDIVSMLYVYLVRAFPNSALLNMFYSSIILIARYGQDASDIVKTISEISRENVEYLKEVRLQMRQFADFLSKMLKYFTPMVSAIALVIFAGFSSLLKAMTSNMQGVGNFGSFIIIQPANIPSGVLALIFFMQLFVVSYLMSSFALQVRGGFYAEKLRVYSFLDIISTSLIIYGISTFAISTMLKGLFMVY